MKYAKLSNYKIKKILTLFCVDIAAKKAAYLLKINRKTAGYYYHLFRTLIGAKSTKCVKLLSDPIEIDILYVYNQTENIVLGMIDKNGTVFVAEIPSKNDQHLLKTLHDPHLLKALHDNIPPGATICTGKHVCENNLSHYGYRHLEAGNRETELLFGKKFALNAIHSFSSYCKRRLQKFNGSYHQNYYLHFKECEFRFNRTPTQMYEEMLALLKLNSHHNAPPKHHLGMRKFTSSAFTN